MHVVARRAASKVHDVCRLWQLHLVRPVPVPGVRAGAGAIQQAVPVGGAPGYRARCRARLPGGVPGPRQRSRQGRGVVSAAAGAVACFMSHCEWNSTMEGVQNGVPFLAWPYFADQFINEAYICDVWKVGLRAEADETALITQD
jgi:hypothetical protein